MPAPTFRRLRPQSVCVVPAFAVRRWMPAMVLSFMLAVAGACADRLPEQDLRIFNAVPAERVSAAVLWDDFQQNPGQAARTCHGRAVIVTGIVTQAGTGEPGDRYVYFARTESAGVRAFLLDEAADAILASVRESPRVVLKCFCEGLSTDVVLKSCIDGAR